MNRKTVTLTTTAISLAWAGATRDAEPAENPGHPIYSESLEVLTKHAVDALNTAADGIKAWVQKVRPSDGSRGRFRWAIDARHPANYPSTAYILEGLGYVGIYDQVITEEDRRAGIAWILSTRRPDGSFFDPVIPLASRKAGWILNRYRNEIGGGSVGWFGEPFPQLNEAEDKSVEWIKAQYHDLNPWGAGSRTTRHMRQLLSWHKQGKVPLQPLVDSLRYVYSIQDPETGLFDSKNTIQDRINGTMKMFGFTQGKLDLPMPHTEKIIDTVLDQRMLTPEYDRLGADGCNELDNWMVISEAFRKTDAYRKEEIQKLAAHRILRILRDHRKPDGGLSSRTDVCQTGWNGIKMASAKAQGDALGLAALSRSVSVCVRLMQIEDKTTWTGQRGWDPSDRTEVELLRRKIESLVFPPQDNAVQ